MVERDDAGFVLTGVDLLTDGKRPDGWRLDRDPYWLETSVPGIFAAGDVRARSVKRIASAVGEGSMAVQFVHQYLASLRPMSTDLLQEFALFSGVPEKDLDRLCQMSETVAVRAGEVLIAEGTLGTDLYHRAGGPVRGVGSGPASESP